LQGGEGKGAQEAGKGVGGGVKVYKLMSFGQTSRNSLSAAQKEQRERGDDDVKDDV